MSFSAEALTAIDTTKEVTIETRTGARTIGTTIWVVVDGGEVFARSYLGDLGRWYQRALAEPNCTIVAGGLRVDVVAVPATDDDSIERCSAALARKYSGRSLDAMLLSSVLHTTLRLDPAAL